jgi:hypothetical protein
MLSKRLFVVAAALTAMLMICNTDCTSRIILPIIPEATAVD